MFAQSQSLFKNPAYNSITDFTPAGLIAEQPLLLLTIRRDLPAQNLKEFAAYVKANQASMQFASAGVGRCVLLGVLPVHGCGRRDRHPCPISLLGPCSGGYHSTAVRIDFYCPLAVAGVPLMQNKLVKTLAVLTQERSPLLPDMPTAKEQGFNGIDGYYWMGFFFPREVPQPIVKKLNEAINEALDTPAVQERLRTLVAIVVPRERRSPAYLETYLASEIENGRRR